tara:strand:+ start:5187 stop:5348 length:162 start_codon:yes stop_codon:yes gene_type:complete
MSKLKPRLVESINDYEQFEDRIKATKSKKYIKKLIAELKQSIKFLEKRILLYM